jgi:hypothetical protein
MPTKKSEPPSFVVALGKGGGYKVISKSSFFEKLLGR